MEYAYVDEGELEQSITRDKNVASYLISFLWALCEFLPKLYGWILQMQSFFLNVRILLMYVLSLLESLGDWRVRLHVSNSWHRWATIWKACKSSLIWELFLIENLSNRHGSILDALESYEYPLNSKEKIRFSPEISSMRCISRPTRCESHHLGGRMELKRHMVPPIQLDT